MRLSLIFLMLFLGLALLMAACDSGDGETPGQVGDDGPAKTTLNSVSPKNGASGDLVTLSGTQLTTSRIASLRFGNKPALVVQEDSSKIFLKVMVPAQESGFGNPADIVLVTTDGTTLTLDAGFTYTDNTNCNDGGEAPSIGIAQQVNLLNTQEPFIHVFGDQFQAGLIGNLAGAPLVLHGFTLNTVDFNIPRQIETLCDDSFPCTLDIDIANANGCMATAALVVTKQGEAVEKKIQFGNQYFGTKIIAMNQDFDADGKNDFMALSLDFLAAINNLTSSSANNLIGDTVGFSTPWPKSIHSLTTVGGECIDIDNNYSYSMDLGNVGDFSGDGKDDIAVLQSLNIAYHKVICFGKSDGTGFDQFKLLGNTTNKLHGIRLAASADLSLDVDTTKDFIVSRDFYQDSQNFATGVVDFYSGSKVFDGITNNSTILRSFKPPTSEPGFGVSLLNLGDLNGDQFEEIIVGSLGATAAVRLYKVNNVVSLPSATTANLAATVTLTPPAAFSTDISFGSRLLPANDLDGDGFKDFFVVASGPGSSGVVYAYSSKAVFDSAGSANPAPLYRLAGFRTATPMVADVGDTNGDLISDFAVGDSDFDALPTVPYRAGRVLVYSGNFLPGTQPSAIFYRNGAAQNDNFGYSILNAGDANQDGISEIFASAPSTFGNNNNGIFLFNMFSPNVIFPTN